MASRYSITYTTAEKALIASSLSDLQTTNSGKLLHLTADEKRKLRKMGPRGEGYVNLVMAGVDANTTLAPGTFSLSQHHADKDIRTYLIDERNKLVMQVEGLDNAIIQLGHNLITDADVCASVILKAAKTDQNLQGLADSIKEYRAKSPIDHPHIVVPKGGSVYQEGIKNGTRITNYGSTVLTVTNHGVSTSNLTVGPHDSAVIPNGWASIDVSNGSGTSDGEFTL